MIDPKKKKKNNQMKIASLSWAATAFIYIFVRWVYPPLATPVRSTKLQNVGFFFLRMADVHYYREGTQLGVRGFVHSSFSYCLRMSVENAPATQTHTHTQTNRHRTHTHFMPVPIARGYNRRNTSNHFVVSSIHNRCHYVKLLNSELCSHLLTCAAIK